MSSKLSYALFSVALLSTFLAAPASGQVPKPRTPPPVKHSLVKPLSTTSALPLGWTCNGNCGMDVADGVVPLSPTGNTGYEWVSTAGGVTGVGNLPSGALGDETDGSTLATPVFSATAGTPLNFYFNYVTSDGAGFADYAWAELYTSSNVPVALLFTARTEETGSIIPGTGLPAPLATLTPAAVPIVPGGPAWSTLGSYTGECYDTGCGYTGWVLADYVIPKTGNYYLKVGVVNWIDQIFDSGLAVDGVTIGGAPISLLSGTLQVEYGTDAHTSWLALASATDAKGIPSPVQAVATKLGYDHFNWLQIITSDLQLQACAKNKKLAGCSSDFASNGAVPSIPTADPPPGGYAYELCSPSESKSDHCQSSFPAQDYWPMYMDEYFSPVGSSYYPNPSAPEYTSQFRSGNLLTNLGSLGQPAATALGYYFSDAPVTTFSVPGSSGTPESIAFVDSLVGVKGKCNTLAKSGCTFQIIPGTTFKWTAAAGSVNPVLTPGGPGTSASLAKPLNSKSPARAKQLDNFPASPLDLTGPELSGSVISVDQFLSLAGLTTDSLAAMGGSVASVSASLVPSEAVALAAYNAGLKGLAEGQVTTTSSGLAYSRVTQVFTGTIKIENVGHNTINGPIQLFLLNVPTSVTIVNPVGTLAGVPYITLPSSNFAPGQSLTVSVQLKNPANATINLEPAPYSGEFK
jgi:hypothetical protein